MPNNVTKSHEYIWAVQQAISYHGSLRWSFIMNRKKSFFVQTIEGVSGPYAVIQVRTSQVDSAHLNTTYLSRSW